MPPSNVFRNRFDEFVDSNDEENIISYYQNRNTTSLLLPATRTNRDDSHFEIEGRVTEKNKIADHSGIEEEMEGANRNIFDVSYVYKRTIRCS